MSDQAARIREALEGVDDRLPDRTTRVTPRRHVVAVATLAAGLVACVAPLPAPSARPVIPASARPSAPDPSPPHAAASASPAVAAVATPTPTPALAVCALERAPGRADVAPVNGDLMDWSHIFGGRIRVCLDMPVALELEGSAFCTWTEGLGAVRDVSGLRAKDAAVERLEAGVSLDEVRVGVSRIDPLGVISSWEGGPNGVRVDAAESGRRGTATFDVRPLIDPENPPVVPAPNVRGVLRWSCLEPPSG